MTEYWDNHYFNDGVSAGDDVNLSRRWKRQILLEKGFNPDKSIIDVACGDMVFWEGLHLLNYTGIDISPTIIEKNRKKYPSYKFYCENSSKYIDIPKADIVTCFDMLFHIMNEDEYIQTLINLTRYSKDKIFIYTWHSNPFDSFINRLIIKKPFQRNVITDGKYQYYRNFEAYSKKYIEPTFYLEGICDSKKWKYGMLYYYVKKE